MVRIDDATWADYGKLCEEEGTSRADDLRRHVHARVNAWRARNRRERLVALRDAAHERTAAERAAGEPAEPPAES